MGKSTMVESVLRSYPQVLAHKSYGGAKFAATQIVWLKINCPHNGSLSALCRSFFHAVDQATGTTNYAQKYGHPKITIDTLISGMRQVAATYYLGVLVIDELQNLSVAKSGGAELMMNYFMNLRSEIRTPLILVGTYKAVSLFGQEMRFARRASENGLTDLFRPTDHKDPTWRAVVEAIWRYQWLRKPSELTEEIYETLFDCCQGITEVLVALFSYAQEIAIADDSDDDCAAVSAELIRESYESAFVLMHPSIDALRSNDVRKLQLFEDLLPPGGFVPPTRGNSPPAQDPERLPTTATAAETQHAAVAPDLNITRKSSVTAEGGSQNDDVRQSEGLQKAIAKKEKIPGAPM